MDCVLFNQLLAPRIFISSNVHHQSFGNSHNNIVGIGHYRKRLSSPNLNTWTCRVAETPFENGSLFETLSAEITPQTIDFFVSETEGDPDCPTKGYSSIGEALNALSQGKMMKVGKWKETLSWQHHLLVLRQLHLW